MKTNKDVVREIKQNESALSFLPGWYWREDNIVVTGAAIDRVKELEEQLQNLTDDFEEQAAELYELQAENSCLQGEVDDLRASVDNWQDLAQELQQELSGNRR